MLRLSARAFRKTALFFFWGPNSQPLGSGSKESEGPCRPAMMPHYWRRLLRPLRMHCLFSLCMAIVVRWVVVFESKRLTRAFGEPQQLTGVDRDFLP